MAAAQRFSRAFNSKVRVGIVEGYMAEVADYVADREVGPEASVIELFLAVDDRRGIDGEVL